MKLKQLSNEYLNFMIKEYSKNHDIIFTWDIMDKMFPDEKSEFKSDALRQLSSDGLVNIFWADDIPYNINLQTDTIIEAESNTKLIRMYKILKEIKQWI